MDSGDLDPVLHQASRLRIMTALFKNRELAFTTLRELLGLTDGNLASHLRRLEGAGYVRQGRVLVGVGFEVHAKITEDGSAAFRSYLARLRVLLEELEPPPERPERDARTQAGPGAAKAPS